MLLAFIIYQDYLYFWELGEGKLLQVASCRNQPVAATTKPEFGDENSLKYLSFHIINLMRKSYYSRLKD